MSKVPGDWFNWMEDSGLKMISSFPFYFFMFLGSLDFRINMESIWNFAPNGRFCKSYSGFVATESVARRYLFAVHSIHRATIYRNASISFRLREISKAQSKNNL